VSLLWQCWPTTLAIVKAWHFAVGRLPSGPADIFVQGVIFIPGQETDIHGFLI
jgi:hypothetical protein